MVMEQQYICPRCGSIRSVFVTGAVSSTVQCNQMNCGAWMAKLEDVEAEAG